VTLLRLGVVVDVVVVVVVVVVVAGDVVEAVLAGTDTTTQPQPPTHPIPSHDDVSQRHNDKGEATDLHCSRAVRQSAAPSGASG
jgi:predicted metalloprotease